MNYVLRDYHHHHQGARKFTTAETRLLASSFLLDLEPASNSAHLNAAVELVSSVVSWRCRGVVVVKRGVEAAVSVQARLYMPG